jgi:hypothetical protein
MLTRFVRKQWEILPCKILKFNFFLNISALGNRSIRSDDFGHNEIWNLLSDRFVFSHGADLIRLIRASHVVCSHAR